MRVDLRRALGRLPRRQREAIVLRYYLDLDVAEVADRDRAHLRGWGVDRAILSPAALAAAKCALSARAKQLASRRLGLCHGLRMLWPADRFEFRALKSDQRGASLTAPERDSNPAVTRTFQETR